MDIFSTVSDARKKVAFLKRLIRRAKQQKRELKRLVAKEQKLERQLQLERIISDDSYPVAYGVTDDYVPTRKANLNHQDR